ncbi:DUF2805 domain-containing protein [Pelomonas aquatica]|uniref:DUF2805 domain-containing protein n=2 Tax=Pelomonas aquatica TaxID=431058 RepID=A0A9X4RA50_9BURK|nr:DUF2805 domain-containing protein [Pelomonas aquatica]
MTDHQVHRSRRQMRSVRISLCDTQSPMAKPAPKLTAEELKRVIATAWDDTPPFSKVMLEHGIGHGELVALLKRELTPSAYKLWAAKGKAAKAPTKRSTWPHGR